MSWAGEYSDQTIYHPENIPSGRGGGSASYSMTQGGVGGCLSDPETS